MQPTILLAVVSRGFHINTMRTFRDIRSLTDYIKANTKVGFGNQPHNNLNYLDGYLIKTWSAWWVFDGHEGKKPKRLNQTDLIQVGLR